MLSALSYVCRLSGPLGSGPRRRARTVRCAALMALMPILAMALPAAPALATGAVATPATTPPIVHGYPLVLARGSHGEVWYGGATNAAGCSGTRMCPSDFVERIDEIGPAGGSRTSTSPRPSWDASRAISLRVLVASSGSSLTAVPSPRPCSARSPPWASSR